MPLLKLCSSLLNHPPVAVMGCVPIKTANVGTSIESVPVSTVHTENWCALSVSFKTIVDALIPTVATVKCTLVLIMTADLLVHG